MLYTLSLASILCYTQPVLMEIIHATAHPHGEHPHHRQPCRLATPLAKACLRPIHHRAFLTDRHRNLAHPLLHPSPIR
jgi:hypothetical protein